MVRRYEPSGMRTETGFRASLASMVHSLLVDDSLLGDDEASVIFVLTGQPRARSPRTEKERVSSCRTGFSPSTGSGRAEARPTLAHTITSARRIRIGPHSW